jgi:hypothetical protein
MRMEAMEKKKTKKKRRISDDWCSDAQTTASHGPTYKLLWHILKREKVFILCILFSYLIQNSS